MEEITHRSEVAQNTAERRHVVKNKNSEGKGSLQKQITMDTLLWTCSSESVTMETIDEGRPPFAYVMFDAKKWSGEEGELPPPPPPLKSIFTNPTMSSSESDNDARSKEKRISAADEHYLREAETDNTLLALWDLVLNACASIDTLLHELLNPRECTSDGS